MDSDFTADKQCATISSSERLLPASCGRYVPQYVTVRPWIELSILPKAIVAALTHLATTLFVTAVALPVARGITDVSARPEQRSMLLIVVVT